VRWDVPVQLVSGRLYLLSQEGIGRKVIPVTIGLPRNDKVVLLLVVVGESLFDTKEGRSWKTHDW
jgi:hypothetical protein